MKHTILIVVILTIITSVVLLPTSAEASEGLPGSPKFGYGAQIDIMGGYLEKSIEIASDIGLDWVAVEFNWEEMWSNPDSPPMLNTLSEVIFQADQKGLSVLLSITNPPQWAISEIGPDPQTTANLVLSLVNFYSGKVLAVELFPGVNTQEGWNAAPNPAYYLNALKRTHETLVQAGRHIALVTTVTPEALFPSKNDINDLDFLSDLYTSGGKPYLTIVGVKFNKLIGNPLTNTGLLSLRHYEEVRSIMLVNEHNYGTIWITGFRLPSIDTLDINQSNKPPVTVEEQSNWVRDAYKLMRAQLYIGVAFFDQINPNINSPGSTQVTIISNDLNPHMIANSMMELIKGFKQNTEQLNQNISAQNQENPSTTNNNFFSILLNKLIHQIDFNNP